jgi:hypothetical protein
MNNPACDSSCNADLTRCRPILYNV